MPVCQKWKWEWMAAQTQCWPEWIQIGSVNCTEHHGQPVWIKMESCSLCRTSWPACVNQSEKLLAVPSTRASPCQWICWKECLGKSKPKEDSSMNDDPIIVWWWESGDDRVLTMKSKNQCWKKNYNFRYWNECATGPPERGSTSTIRRPSGRWPKSKYRRRASRRRASRSSSRLASGLLSPHLIMRDILNTVTQLKYNLPVPGTEEQ